jgi:voltage-gated potassium channel
LKKYSDQYSFLLACMLFVIALMPIIIESFDIKILISILFSLVAISATYAMTQKKYIYIISIVLLIPLIISLWLSFITESYIAHVSYLINSIIFLSFIAVNIILSTYRAKVVNKEVIYGAMAVYLLIGFIWSFYYGLIEYLHPGSFRDMSNGGTFGHQPFIYFSFVTLTTLGFGDITPITPVARSLVILEAVIGQLYLIINVSWLVGLYVARIHEERKS